MHIQTQIYQIWALVPPSVTQTQHVAFTPTSILCATFVPHHPPPTTTTVQIRQSPCKFWLPSCSYFDFVVCFAWSNYCISLLCSYFSFWIQDNLNVVGRRFDSCLFFFFFFTICDGFKSSEICFDCYIFFSNLRLFLIPS